MVRLKLSKLTLTRFRTIDLDYVGGKINGTAQQ